jgi:hypothetical protein
VPDQGGHCINGRGIIAARRRNALTEDLALAVERDRFDLRAASTNSNLRHSHG